MYLLAYRMEQLDIFCVLLFRGLLIFTCLCLTVVLMCFGDERECWKGPKSAGGGS